ncbi:unnamed protein product [Rhizopus stolonifer]
MSHSDLLEEIEENSSEEEESISSSIPDENIDFDLVYALHTFVATVDGQASVVKGDALVLMEDANIYWWLVEVLNTREVGYIPAENIETPYERLARLNKHRNVEITFPSIHDTLPIPMHPLSSQRVTILDEISVFHYEIEEEEEEEEDVESIMSIEHAKEKVEVMDMQEIRVFAGNVGQGFHTFSISDQTGAEELLQWAIDQFEVQDQDLAIEYYVAVQGLDGDEYVLSAQDKPLSIFKTLTDSLTTPMPSLSKRISQPSRRRRSSSFSNYEQTNHDEDSVIRFYLHRRIKRAQENLAYIKVSLYPESHKKKVREMDRMDKVIAVAQDALVGQVIQLALEKFHVPDILKQYTMSVKSQHKEIELESNEEMSNVLEKLSSNTITSELIFMLKSGKRKLHFPKRRPSILDILMETPKQEEKLINTHSLFRRSSAPEMERPAEKRKESLRQQFKRLVGWGSNTTSPIASRKQSLTETKSRQGSADQNSSRFEVVSCVSESNEDDALSPQEDAEQFIQNDEHIGPLDPIQPTSPAEPIQEHVEPVQEEEPVETTEPVECIEPVEIIKQVEPVVEPLVEKEEIQLEALPEKSSDIQAEYSMWINNQPNEEETPTPLDSSMSTSMSTSKVSLVSEMSMSYPTIQTKPVESHGLDDLYLLVAHGVDFLKTREDTQWEEEGGYEFHPWNRAQSSFAVRPKDKKLKPQPISTSPSPPPPSPPSPPVPAALNQPTDEQQKELAMSMAKRILSGKVEVAPIETPVLTPDIAPEMTPNNNNNNNQTKPALDDEELQRIVAAHIVF